jgi:hypothetical protein
MAVALGRNDAPRVGVLPGREAYSQLLLLNMPCVEVQSELVG